MQSEPLVIGTKQISVVVSDLARTMKHYSEILQIGPWAVYTYAPPDLQSMKVHGHAAPYSMQLAIAWSGGLMWEIIQPLSGRSIYREFLEKYGDGVHHVCISSSQPPALLRHHLEAKGLKPAMEGTFKGTRFTYYDAMEELHTIIEVIDRPAGAVRSLPQYWYPGPPTGPYGDFRVE